MFDITITCHTEGCGNEGIPIVLTVDDPDIMVVCGVCSVEVTDIEGGSDE